MGKNAEKWSIQGVWENHFWYVSSSGWSNDKECTLIILFARLQPCDDFHRLYIPWSKPETSCQTTFSPYPLIKNNWWSMLLPLHMVTRMSKWKPAAI